MSKFEASMKPNARPVGNPDDKRLAGVRRKVQIGLEQLNRGAGIQGEKVSEEMKHKSRLLRSRRTRWK